MADFPLEEAIRGWRIDLARGGSRSAQELEELERQLRQRTASLIDQGLSPGEAFGVASRQLVYPAPPMLNYASAAASMTDRHRLLWMLVGVMAWLLIGGMANLAATLTLVAGALVGCPGTVLGLLAAAVRVLVFVGLAVLGFMVWQAMSSRGGSYSAGRITGPLIVAALILPLLAVVDRFAWPLVYSQLAGIGEVSGVVRFQSIANLAWSAVVPLVIALFILSLLRGPGARARRP